jgi:hypothetical protein
MNATIVSKIPLPIRLLPAEDSAKGKYPATLVISTIDDNSTTSNANPYIGVYSFRTVFGFMKMYHRNHTIPNTTIKFMSPEI